MSFASLSSRTRWSDLWLLVLCAWMPLSQVGGLSEGFGCVIELWKTRDAGSWMGVDNWVEEKSITFKREQWPAQGYKDLPSPFTCSCSSGKVADWSRFSRSLHLITCVMGPCRSIFVPG